MRHAALVLSLAAALAACGSKPAAEPAAPAAEAPGGIVENTPVQVSKAPRPAWASDYPGSPPQTPPVAIVTDGRADATFSFSTDDSPEEVIAFYRGKAEAAGLAAQQAGNVAAGTTVYAAGGDGGRLVVAVTPERGQSHVMVTWNVPETE